jgi:hypothetical protein
MGAVGTDRVGRVIVGHDEQHVRAVLWHGSSGVGGLERSCGGGLVVLCDRDSWPPAILWLG